MVVVAFSINPPTEISSSILSESCIISTLMAEQFFTTVFTKYFPKIPA